MIRTSELGLKLSGNLPDIVIIASGAGCILWNVKCGLVKLSRTY